MPDKRIEITYLEWFQKCVGADFPAGTIEVTECPDFIVRGPTETTGIEFTRLYRPPSGESPPLQAQESWEDEILRQAEAFYDPTLKPPISVSVEFEEAFRMTKGDIPFVAGSLADLVRRSVRQFPQAKILNCWAADQLPYGVKSVMVARGTMLSRSWQTARAGLAHRLTIPELQRLIDQKNVRCATYRERCSLLWLVLVVEWTAPSRYVELTSDAASHPFITDFDRIFYFDTLKSEAVELRASCHGAA